MLLLNLWIRKVESITQSTDAAPGDAQLQMVSPANDWRYWNGVLNIAMIETGEALHDSAYTNFSIRNIAFSFDNYQYFAKKHKAKRNGIIPSASASRWKSWMTAAPWEQASSKSIASIRQNRYRRYIDEVANYITAKQYRYEDSTLVRPVSAKVDDLGGRSLHECFVSRSHG